MDRISEIATPQPTDPPVAAIRCPSEALDQGCCDVYSEHVDMSPSGQEQSVEDIGKDSYDALRLRNSLLSFHQIPPEIHADILSLGLIEAWDIDEGYERLHIYKGDCNKYYKQLHTYAQVSYLWGCLVLNTPSFWSKISGVLGPELCAIALTRSKDHPLDVFIDHSTTADVYSLIAPTGLRWISITLELESEQSRRTLQPALEQPMPHLRSAAQLCEAPSPVNLGAGQPGLLKYLTIATAAVPWDSGALLGLKTLVMCSSVSPAPTWMQFHDLLQNAIHLESLTMADVHVMDLSTTRKSSAPINLPSFRDVNLKEVEPFLLRNIFEAFHLPNCNACDIRLNMQNNSFRDIFTSATNHMLPVFGALVNTSSDVTIILSYCDCEIGATVESPDEDSGDKEIFRIDLEEVADPHEFPKWIAGMGIDKRTGDTYLTIRRPDSPTNTTSTEVDVAYHGLKPGRSLTKATLDALISDIDHLPIVSELYLSLGVARIGPLLEHLTPSETRMAVVEEWPLPRLRGLYIRGDSFTLDSLLAMVRARCGPGGTGSMESGLLCSTLDRLILEDIGKIPEHVKREISQLLGLNNFVCR